MKPANITAGAFFLFSWMWQFQARHPAALEGFQEMTNSSRGGWSQDRFLGAFMIANDLSQHKII